MEKVENEWRQRNAPNRVENFRIGPREQLEQSKQDSEWKQKRRKEYLNQLQDKKNQKYIEMFHLQEERLRKYEEQMQQKQEELRRKALEKQLQIEQRRAKASRNQIAKENEIRVHIQHYDERCKQLDEHKKKRDVMAEKSKFYQDQQRANREKLRGFMNQIHSMKRIEIPEFMSETELTAYLTQNGIESINLSPKKELDPIPNESYNRLLGSYAFLNRSHDLSNHETSGNDGAEKISTAPPTKKKRKSSPKKTSSKKFPKKSPKKSPVQSSEQTTIELQGQLTEPSTKDSPNKSSNKETVKSSSDSSPSITEQKTIKSTSLNKKKPPVTVYVEYIRLDSQDMDRSRYFLSQSSPNSNLIEKSGLRGLIKKKIVKNHVLPPLDPELYHTTFEKIYDPVLTGKLNTQELKSQKEKSRKQKSKKRLKDSSKPNFNSEETINNAEMCEDMDTQELENHAEHLNIQEIVENQENTSANVNNYHDNNNEANHSFDEMPIVVEETEVANNANEGITPAPFMLETELKSNALIYDRGDQDQDLLRGSNAEVMKLPTITSDTNDCNDSIDEPHKTVEEHLNNGLSIEVRE